MCDVLPDGMDLVGWFGVGWIVVLLSGFYLWYWPGVRRWATAFVIRRGRGSFAFNMSLHKVIGFVVWIPLPVVAFTGIAFAFPNLNGWFENVTPAARDYYLWTPPEEAVGHRPRPRAPRPRRGPRRHGGAATPTGCADLCRRSTRPGRTRPGSPAASTPGPGRAAPATPSGDRPVQRRAPYDGTPEEGNVFDQAWDDWTFPLHTGDFLGTTSRVLWVGLALSPVALGVTGVVMNRIRAAKRARRRPSPARRVETFRSEDPAR